MRDKTSKDWLFVGGYGTAIETFSFDASTGALSSVAITDHVPESPTFLTLDAERRVLFAISEKAGPDAPEPGRATSYLVEASSGTLTRTSEVWSGGSNTVSVQLSRSRKSLLTASSSTVEGRVAVIPVSEQGELTMPSDSQVAGKNAHGQAQSADGRFVWVTCRGDEHVAQYRFDEAAGKLEPLSPAAVQLPRPSGPRRITVHPSLPVAYVVLDWSGEIATYQIGSDGQLGEPSITSVFPRGLQPQAVTGTMTAADLEVSADGKWVYASTRTPQCQSIAILAVDATGSLTLIDNQLAGGLVAGPRHFTLSPDNRFLFVANQDNDTLLVLAVHPETGRLSLRGQAVPTRVKKPNAVAFGSLELA